MYLKLEMYINGEWTQGTSGKFSNVINPATEQMLGSLPLASADDLDNALKAAETGFGNWSRMSAYDRSVIMRKVALIVRERVANIARLMTLEQGKPLTESTAEAASAADHIEWYAEEGRRAYGRLIPPRSPNVRQMVVQDPIGPVAAFTPWNFPINQAVRKIAGALAAGCSIIIKAPEETPASCIELVRCFHDAGVPAGVVNLVFGVPHEVSEYLIASPIIHKVSFTGSTRVGKLLGELAARHVKRTTMELGGHAPFIVCEDADLEPAVKLAVALKLRNAGQVCAAPSRFYVHRNIFDQFVSRFKELSSAVVIGVGTDSATQMGPLANIRRLQAMESFVSDAVSGGAEILAGGARVHEKGYFYPPTIMISLNDQARVLHDEPFGPIAPFMPFDELDEVIWQANSLPYGLASFAFTRSIVNATELGNRLATGMVSINHFGLALPETPFGGIGESGFGSEGGMEGLQAYMMTRFISQAAA